MRPGVSLPFYRGTFVRGRVDAEGPGQVLQSQGSVLVSVSARYFTIRVPFLPDFKILIL